jgi:hypothetical protein
MFDLPIPLEGDSVQVVLAKQQDHGDDWGRFTANIDKTQLSKIHDLFPNDPASTTGPW